MKTLANNTRTENMNAADIERVDECTTKYNNVNAARIVESVLNIAEAVGLTYGSSLPAHDAKIDIIRFAQWMSGEAAEGLNINYPFFFAIRKQGSESGTREHCKSRCAVLGAPVYVIKVERKAADLFALYIRVSSHTAAAEVFAAATAAEDAQSLQDNEQTNTPATTTESKKESRAARVWSILKDYAAGTWEGIKTRSRKAWKKAAPAAARFALRAFRVLWMVGILAASLGVMVAVACYLGENELFHKLPELVRIPFGIVAVFGGTFAVEFALLMISRRIDRATDHKLLAMH